jgi:hypothetical protein
LSSYGELEVFIEINIHKELKTIVLIIYNWTHSIAWVVSLPSKTLIHMWLGSKSIRLLNISQFISCQRVLRRLNKSSGNLLSIFKIILYKIQSLFVCTASDSVLDEIQT